MTVTMNQFQRVGPSTWNISWTSDLEAPLFHVYMNGILYLETYANNFNYTVELNESPVFQVFDNTTDRPLDAFPDRFTINWLYPGDPSEVDYFLVHEYDDGDWVDREKVLYDGKIYYSYISRVLEDQTVFTFKITPIGINGNEGTPSYYSALMVRYPDPPAPGYSYSSGTTKITITE